MRARFSLCFLFAATCFARAESSLQHWTELGRLAGEVVAWEGEGSSDGRTIRLAGVSFPSSKSIFQVIDNPPENRQLAFVGAGRSRCRRRIKWRLLSQGFHSPGTGGLAGRNHPPLRAGEASKWCSCPSATVESSLCVPANSNPGATCSKPCRQAPGLWKRAYQSPGSMTRGALVGPSSRTTERANGLSSLLPRLHWPMPLDSFAQKESSDPSRLPTR